MTGGTALILGPTGRNVAAGMSGGVAYVLDLDHAHVNRELVDLGPLRPEDELVVHDLLERHHAWTDSPVAARLLADWDTARSAFTLVLPRAYQRVIDVRSQGGGGGPRPRRRPGVGADHGGLPWLTPRAFCSTRERELPRRRPVPVRIKDWKEVYEEQPATELQRQAGRCMDCGIPFCHSGCPLGNLIPEWNDLAWKGEWRQAIDRLHATNNFPEFTGRLCPAPCESACVLGINQPAVTIKQVEVSIIDRAFANGTVTPEAPERLSGKTVAVVGSGPAGLAAAQQLTRAGHTVAVYERADQPGGLLRYGIPEFKMEKSVLDRRIGQMKSEGTRFRTGVDVGRDLTGADLRKRFDAVVVAIGATVPRDLPVPGRELDGVMQAMDFLPPANRVALGQSVDGPGHRRRQGRHRHRRRRHRRRLHRHGAPPGRRARSPASRSCRSPRPSAPRTSRGRPTR